MPGFVGITWILYLAFLATNAHLIFEPVWTSNSTVSAQPIKCNFGIASPTLCDFIQDQTDHTSGDTGNYDWSLGKDGTPSGGTGPEEDNHAPGVQAGYFLFIETSDPQLSQTSAR